MIDISALEFVPDEDRWLLDHSPNLGGRGTSYSLGDLDRYVNTIFDINEIDESKELKVYYDADHTVQFIMSQKNKRVDDIHGNLKDLLASGFAIDSAIYLNYEQQIISEGASFNNKINKRKKQIEVESCHYSPIDRLTWGWQCCRWRRVRDSSPDIIFGYRYSN